jgi:hypothetical protein
MACAEILFRCVWFELDGHLVKVNEAGGTKHYSSHELDMVGFS